MSEQLRDAIDGLVDTDFRSEQSHTKQREGEVAQITKMIKKPPSKSICGFYYSDTVEEKEFSDKVKSRLKKAFPALENNKKLFYFMAFSSLDRINCRTCSKCTTLPASVFGFMSKGHADKPIDGKSIY